jgi:hypothetical protein
LIDGKIKVGGKIPNGRTFANLFAGEKTDAVDFAFPNARFDGQHIRELYPIHASYLANEFQPKFDMEDLLNLSNQSSYLKPMIDGAPSPAFSARAYNGPRSIPAPART